MSLLPPLHPVGQHHPIDTGRQAGKKQIMNNKYKLQVRESSRYVYTQQLDTATSDSLTKHPHSPSLADTFSCLPGSNLHERYPITRGRIPEHRVVKLPDIEMHTLPQHP